ncbi:MAG: ERCC4 domain-containing protein [Candidatus Micrarchaeia archaeon]
MCGQGQLDFSECAERQSRPLVYADHREDPLVIALIEKMGCAVKQVQLEVGDYIVSARAAVERKTREDFENSIIDGRLFEQASRITSAYEKVVYIIEGHSFNERINRRALMAAVSSLILNNNISLFFTRDPEGTAELISALAHKEQIESRRTVLLRKPIKRDNPNLAVLYVAAALPNIGEKTAEKLLLHFGTLQALFNATEQDLMAVKGIGKQRARELAKMLRTRYTGIEK